MSDDGYSVLNNKFSICLEKQKAINLRLKEIATEIHKLPKMTSSVDKWIDSWSGIRSRGFGIDTLNKKSKIEKEYTGLINDSEDNLREMKIILIEELICKIDNLLK